MSVTTAVAAHSTIGLKGLVIAPITADTAASTTYGTLQAVEGMIEASVTPNNTDPEIQYADDKEFEVTYPDPDITFKTKLVDLPLSIKAMIENHAIDSNGVMTEYATDFNQPLYFAVGFESEKSNGKGRKVWLYKCRATPVTDNYATKEGDTITHQEPEVEWTAIKRVSDQLTRCIVDEDNTASATIYPTFLDSVYTPVPVSSGV